MNILCVSASDSSGGAGMQRDVAVAVAHGCHPLCALTGVTVQTHQQLLHIEPLPVDLLRRQLDACLRHYGIDVVKVGALCGERQAPALAEALRAVNAPVVLDPVFAPTRGSAFLHDVDLWRRELLPLATVITPNRGELTRLTDMRVENAEQAIEAARTLGVAVFVTGGHFEGEGITEWLVRGEEVHSFTRPRIALRQTHGTGCVLSAALACRLAMGESLTEACRHASLYVDEVMGTRQGGTM